jgi:GH24 family phage-related lysozyme (muramidase)
MQLTDKQRRISSAVAIATAVAIPMEGLRQFAYYDPPGVLTVCYGSTTDVVKGKKYSLEECKQRLDNDMLDAVLTVERCVPGLPDNVLAAFGDAVYNIGPRIACDTNRSTAARLLKAGNIEGACNELPKWNKARVAGVMVTLPGLTKRRNLEKLICLEGQ